MKYLKQLTIIFITIILAMGNFACANETASPPVVARVVVTEKDNTEQKEYEERAREIEESMRQMRTGIVQPAARRRATETALEPAEVVLNVAPEMTQREKEAAKKELQKKMEQLTIELAAIHEQLANLERESLETGQIQIKTRELKDKSDNLKKMLSEMQKLPEYDLYTGGEEYSRSFDGFPGMTAPTTGMGIGVSSSGSERNIVVIPSEDMSTEDISNIIEDMTIMIRIFNNKIGSPPLQPAYNRVLVQPYIVQTGSRVAAQNKGTTEGIYIAGYGALFLMNVDFPLTEPPLTDEEPEEQGTDSEWEQAKQEIFLRPQARSRSKAATQPKFDRERVAELKDKLIRTIRLAANIRAIDPDECVTVSITGATNQPTRTQTIVQQTMAQERAASISVISQPTGQPTFMTIKIDKSDLDDLTGEDNDYNKLYECVEITTH